MASLKPCPFCGSENLEVCDSFGFDFDSAVVNCPSCKAEGPKAETEDGAIEKWNQRKEATA